MSPLSLRQFVLRVALDARRLGSFEVCEYVCAPERVDGLLRISDEDQGRIGERAFQDLPLHGVGVLELVHENDPRIDRTGAGKHAWPRSVSVSASRRRVRRSS